MSQMNRLWNASNGWQGKTKRVLCLCSAGLLRSPTTAYVLSSDPYNYNTRAAGLAIDYALIPVDKVLLAWAEEIVVMDVTQLAIVEGMLEEYEIAKPPIKNLNIPDNFGYRDPELIELIKTNYGEPNAH